MNLDEVDGLKSLMERCGEKLNVTPIESDLAKIAEELTRLDVRAEERQRALVDPFSSEMIGEVEGTMKTLSAHEQVALRLLLKYGDMTDRVNAHKVREKLPSPSPATFLQGLHDRTGWLQRTQTSPFPNVSREEDAYAVLPRMRPYLTVWFERNS
jgi:hypothetical protein